MGPLSERQKGKRAVVGFLFDYLPIRRSWRFFKTEWRGLKAGRALLILACSASVGVGLWGGCRIERYRSTAATPTAPRTPRSESAREWPPLTNAQIQEWVDALKSRPKAVILILFDPEVEAIEFYRSLKTVGKSLGWDVGHGTGWDDRAVSGMKVTATVDYQGTAEMIVQLLNRMNYPARFALEDGKEGAIIVTIPERTN
jgi:hypothetical protein